MDNNLTRVAFTYLAQEDKVLILQEGGKRAKGLWSLPGGHVDEGESFEQAAIREAMEESGYEITIEKTIYESLISDTDYKGTLGDTDQVEIVIYKGIITGGKMQIDEQALELKWISKEEALLLPHRWDFLKDLINNN